MAILTNKGGYNWATHDGKYYMVGEYNGSRVRYRIGKNTEQGSIHIEDVIGFRQARKYLQQLIEKEG